MADKLKELLQSLPPEQRLKGLPAKERLTGLSANEVVPAPPPEILEVIARRLKANGSESKNTGSGT